RWKQVAAAAQKNHEAGQGLCRRPRAVVPLGAGDGGARADVRLSRPAHQEADVSRAVDHAHRRGGKNQRPLVQPAHQRPQAGGRGAGPQDSGGDRKISPERLDPASPIEMNDSVEALQGEVLARIEQAGSEKELERIRIEALGRSGSVTLRLRGLGDLPKEERRRAGEQLNQLRRTLEERLEAQLEAVKRRAKSEALKGERLDVTLPGTRRVKG